MENANALPKGVVNIAGILKHFFEHSEIDKSKGYELLCDVSDEVQDLFYGLIETYNIADDPIPHVYLVEVQPEGSDRKLMLKAARYDDQPIPMIAMAVFELKPHEKQEELIESFSLFANETCEGFTPVPQDKLVVGAEFVAVLIDQQVA